LRQPDGAAPLIFRRDRNLDQPGALQPPQIARQRRLIVLGLRREGADRVVPGRGDVRHQHELRQAHAGTLHLRFQEAGDPAGDEPGGDARTGVEHGAGVGDERFERGLLARGHLHVYAYNLPQHNRRHAMDAPRKIGDSVLQLIGGTPLLELKRSGPPDCARILVKIESINPTGSMKDRMALAMIEAAERDGRLKPGGHVVEYTGGSTGVSLALVCAARGYGLDIVTSDAFSAEKRSHM